MYKIESGPLPAGVVTKAHYAFESMNLGDWFFAPGKKASTIRSALTSYKKRKNLPDVKFSCVAAVVDDVAGTICKRVA